MKQKLINGWLDLNEERWHVAAMYDYDINQLMARIESILWERYKYDIALTH